MVSSDVACDFCIPAV